MLINPSSDIFKGLYDSKSPRLTSFVNGLPTGVVDALENDEDEAGQFICQVMQGNVPGIIEDLTDDVWDEIKDDWTAVTDFVESIPTLAPAILEDIIHDGEDVVSIVGDIFTNPGAAVTAIVNGVESVISDIESVGGEVVSGIECLFDKKKCQQSSTADPAATISASCSAILAAATTTYSQAASTSDYYPAATISASCSAILAAATTTYDQAASTSDYDPPAQTSAYQSAAATTTYDQTASTSDYDPPAQTSAYQSAEPTTPAPATITPESTTVTTETSSPTSTELAAATTQGSASGGASQDLGSALLSVWLVCGVDGFQQLFEDDLITSNISSRSCLSLRPEDVCKCGMGSLYAVAGDLAHCCPGSGHWVRVHYARIASSSNAPNNGSWTYNIPSNIEPGRWSFSIGANPLLQSSTSTIFTITASQISGSPALPGPPATSYTAFQSYNGCGLPPLPDYTYTGYQAPCTTTSNGVVETLYPIVPFSDSSSFFSNSDLISEMVTPSVTISSGSTVISASSLSFNSAFATGVYAQALQCPSPVTPSTTKIVAGGATTILSLVGCDAVTGSSSDGGGVCHISDYTTFPISGASSVCCPGGWATTPLNSDLFCFTSTGQAKKRGMITERQVSTETLAESPSTLIEIQGLMFTRAGVVTGEAAVETGSSSTGGIHSATGLLSSTGLATGSVVITSTTKGSALKMDVEKDRGQNWLRIREWSNLNKTLRKSSQNHGEI
ncbi:hypothetical protein D0Z07_9119 [Hyphodiscus hymeniophilus]|uniref:Uncharacterized protein n=1 Tax=Hyphodiscus hymeniophilus TaxID=353542 RepID=A0A9P6SMH1_9HELO|nr:hypothetical protein D0Z07_9119 [Hyphodiscus hymeniophilus]